MSFLLDRSAESEEDLQPPPADRLSNSHGYRLTLAGPLLTAFLSTMAMVQALRVWEWRPGIPLEFDGDAALVLMQVKDILDHGWYWANPDVGAPFGQNAGWFSDGSWIHYAVVRVLGLLSSSPMTVSALYFFLGFPLAGLTAYWLARQIGITRIGAVVVGTLFSVLPGHQLKFGHLWLSGYWVVPLALWLVLVAVGRVPKPSGHPPWWRRSQIAGVVVTVGLGGFYFVAFTAILLISLAAFAVLTGIGRRTALRCLWATCGLAVVAAVPLGAAVLPRTRDVITGPTAGLRGYWQSETFAGKIIELVLPWIHHRVPGLAQVTANYASTTIPSVEQPALGVLGGFGLLGILGVGLAQLAGRPRTSLSPLLGMLTLTALIGLVFYTRGGLGPVFAIAVTPSIRTWSRLVIVLGLLGLLGVGLALSRLGRSRQVLLTTVVASVLIVVGVLDQTNPGVAPAYAAVQAKVSTMTTYVQQLEQRYPTGCAVFQDPVMPFPEQLPILGMNNNDPFRSSIVSRQLRWSYGAMRGTAAADWQLALPSLGPDRALVDDLAAASFCALEVDTAGVPDSARTRETLTSQLGEPVAVTTDGRMLAFDLLVRRDELLRTLGAAEVQRRGEGVLRRLLPAQ